MKGSEGRGRYARGREVTEGKQGRGMAEGLFWRESLPCTYMQACCEAVPLSCVVSTCCNSNKPYVTLYNLLCFMHLYLI